MSGAICIVAIGIALCLAFALRIACGGTGSSSSLSPGAGDPFLFPVGEAPIVPREAIPNYRRHLLADDFRAWGLPPTRPSAAVAHQRNEDGGRRQFPSSAVVLSFPGRRA